MSSGGDVHGDDTGGTLLNTRTQPSLRGSEETVTASADFEASHGRPPLIDVCFAELEAGPTPARAARLHTVIANELEQKNPRDAAQHYRHALEANAEHLPAIRGLRRLLIHIGDPNAALPLFEAELPLLSTPRERAMNHYARGRVLEDVLGEFEKARDAYLAAHRLDGRNVAILKALERIEGRGNKLPDLIDIVGREANAIETDSRYRAALLTERARLSEAIGKREQSVDLYEQAVQLDSSFPGVALELERLRFARGEWRLLCELLESQAERTPDKVLAAISLRRAAHLRAELLSNDADAVLALAAAMELHSKQPLILDELAPYYQDNEQVLSLAEVLRQQIIISTDTGERASLLHLLGHIYELLGHSEEATACYENVLGLDPGHSAAIKALDRLYVRHQNWGGLVRIYAIEAGFTEDPERGAAAHIRAATIYEERLHQPNAAMEHYARALARVPSHPIAFKALCRLYRAAERYRDLVELLDRAAQLATETNQVVALSFQAAQVWEDALGDNDQATTIYHRILELEPGNLAAVQALQRVAERAGRYEDLSSALELELELSTDERRQLALHHRLGTVLSEHLGDEVAAISHFRAILDAEPTDPAALAALGRLYRGAGRWEDLLDIYQRELIRTRDERRAAVLQHKMAELCDRCLGDEERAIDLYRRAISDDPTYRPSVRALAHQLRKRKEWSALIDVLKLEADQATTSQIQALSWYRIGEVFEFHLEQPDNAARAYELALAAVPEHRPTVIALSRLRRQLGDWHPLLSELQQEVETTPDNERRVSLALLRAAIYRDEVGDIDKAIACFESVTADPLGHLPALLALEKLYIQVGDFDKLCSVYRSIANATSDRQAKVAALRELTRVIETHGVGTRDTLLATYREILEIAPGDMFSLSKLEEHAIGGEDVALSEEVYRRLAEAASDPTMRAHYQTQRAAAMEKLSDPRALEVYAAAVAANKESLPAIRGLARTAEGVGDFASLARAFRLEAEQVSNEISSADLYVRSARLCLDSDLDVAIKDLRKAIELDPASVDAAAGLKEGYGRSERFADLAQVLATAAHACKLEQRKTQLWLDVATVQASRLGQYPAAISSLQRGLEASPMDVPSLLKLADFYRHEEQYREAVRALEQVLEASKERELFCRTQLELATLWDEHLDDFHAAVGCVEALVARHALHPDGLSRLASYQARQGKHDLAVDTLHRLIGETRDPSRRVTALIRLAELERERGNERASDEALKEALLVQGLDGPAAEIYRERASATGDWVGYASGLSGYLKAARKNSGELDRDSLIKAHIELAEVYADGMALPKKAIETLEDGLRFVQGHPVLRLELARRYRQVGRLVDARHQIHRLLESDATIAEGWTMLAELFADAGLKEEVDYAQQALGVLLPERLPAKRRRRILAAPLSEAVIHDLAPERATTIPAAALLAATAEAAGKLFPPALERYGLSRRDRIRSGHRILEEAARIAEIFTVEEFDLYIHNGPEPLLSLELTETPAIVLSSIVQSLSTAQRVFVLSYAMSSLATRTYPALRLTSRELELFLAAGARAVVETFSSPLAAEPRLAEHAHVVRRSVPRRYRRAHELSAADYSRSRINTSHWQQSLLHTSIRAALITCDDLASGIAVLRRMHSMPELRGRDLVESSRTVADLMRFWISEPAFVARRRVGIISDPTSPTPTPR